MSATRHIVFVACCGLNREVPCPARDLYQSTLFRFAREWAERRGDGGWFILSAKHGLVAPDALVAPYDETLNRVGVAGRRAWDGAVLAQVRALGPAQITVLAGSKYCGWCDRVPNVSRPLRGLGIGQQLAWFKAQAQLST
jgi:hypothetical protein